MRRYVLEVEAFGTATDVEGEDKGKDTDRDIKGNCMTTTYKEVTDKWTRVADRN